MIELEGLQFKYREPPARDLIILDQVVRHNAYHLPQDMIGWNVMDIGGHIGSVALMSAQRGATVHTFEPTNDSYALLIENIELNGYTKTVHPHSVGVGLPGLRKLYHYQNSESEANSLFPEYYDAMTTEFEEVEIVSLNEAMAVFAGLAQVDFLKLDCEGAETEILPELLKDLAWRIGRIGIEFHVEAAPYLKELERFYVVEPLSHIEYKLTLKELYDRPTGS